MKRSKVSWSNAVDLVEGPCAVCQKEVQYVLPSDRPDPAILYHATCDVMPLLREQLKKANPPLMPSSHVITKPARPQPAAQASVAANPVPSPASSTPPPSTPTPSQ